MPINNLKTLKQRIDSNLPILKTKCPYAQNLSSSINQLIQNNPNNTKAKMWIEGCIEMIVNIEKSLYFNEHGENDTEWDTLRFLKKYIEKYQNLLNGKFPMIYDILGAVNIFLADEGVNFLASVWIKDHKTILSQIEKEIFYIKYMK